MSDHAKLLALRDRLADEVDRELTTAAAVDALPPLRVTSRIGDLEKTISAVDSLLDDIEASQQPRVA